VKSQRRPIDDRSRQTQGIPWVFSFHRPKASRQLGTTRDPSRRQYWLPLWLTSSGSSTASRSFDRDRLLPLSSSVPGRSARYVRRSKPRYEKGPSLLDPLQRKPGDSAKASARVLPPLGVRSFRGLSGDWNPLGDPGRRTPPPESLRNEA
jgi:hypothetical protein